MAVAARPSERENMAKPKKTPTRENGPTGPHLCGRHHAGGGRCPFQGLLSWALPASWGKVLLSSLCHRLPSAERARALVDRDRPRSPRGSSGVAPIHPRPAWGCGEGQGSLSKEGQGSTATPHSPPPLVFSSGHPSFLPSICPFVHLHAPRFPSPLFQRPPAAVTPGTKEKTEGWVAGGQLEGVEE